MDIYPLHFILKAPLETKTNFSQYLSRFEKFKVQTDILNEKKNLEFYQ